MADYTIALYEKPDDFNALVEQNTKNGWKSLTPELRMFCYYYLEDYNHQNAAKRANIKMSGMAALRNPLVNAMIAHLQEETERPIGFIMSGAAAERIGFDDGSE